MAEILYRSVRNFNTHSHSTSPTPPRHLDLIENWLVQIPALLGQKVVQLQISSRGDKFSASVNSCLYFWSPFSVSHSLKKAKSCSWKKSVQLPQTSRKKTHAHILPVRQKKIYWVRILHVTYVWRWNAPIPPTQCTWSNAGGGGGGIVNRRITAQRLQFARRKTEALSHLWGKGKGNNFWICVCENGKISVKNYGWSLPYETLWRASSYEPGQLAGRSLVFYSHGKFQRFFALVYSLLRTFVEIIDPAAIKQQMARK